ncbi:sigma-70 family RNA polymerase sigma factor [Kitasatospora phosalacinea]|uniref:sigma-70 family RNA polymerase sigma factor n=1 Tax=Kitasatospora phosalacinea TaxID=2065 RepID=UPI00068DDCE6|nr:sigma-70 family RNA polymerase sigma factor [Kitasatospora phosalacinea]
MAAVLVDGRREAGTDVPRLVAAAQAGDAAALERLLGAHLTLVHHLIARAVGPGEADDLTQETMLRAVRGLAGLREPERFRSWLVAIAYRRVQEHGRRRVLELPHRLEALDVPDPGTDFADRSVAELALSAQRRELVRATAWLDQADRQLLALWWQEVLGDLDRAELAAALGVEPSHAAVRLKRMKAQLDLVRSLVRALDAEPRCAGLERAAAGWDGRPGSVWRKRLARHLRECAECGGRAAGMVPPERLLPGLGVLLVPDRLADGLGAALRKGVPAAGRSTAGRVTAWTAAGAATVATAVLLAVVPWSGPDSPAPHPPAPGATAPAAPSPAAPPSPSAVASPSASPSATAARSAEAAPPAAFPGVAVADLYVAPDGSDDADGSLAHPFASLARAAAVVRPGQTIALRGGTYRLAAPVGIGTTGTGTQRITLSAYRDEHPVLDASALPASAWAVTQTGGFWTVQGLELRGAAGHGWVCSGCRSTVFQRVAFHGNGRSGLLLRDAGTSGNAVLDSDFYDNRDAAGTAGIGLGLTFGSGGGNVVRGNRLHDNATDGLDLGGFTSPVTVDSNWSYRNGNGFTLGGGDGRTAVAHLVVNNAAWDNSGLGFNDEGNPGALRLAGNSAFRNALFGFYLPDAAAELSADAALGNGRDVQRGPDSRSTGNSWDAPAADLFASTDPSTAEAARPADGGLPPTAFLRPRTAAGATMTEQHGS